MVPATEGTPMASVSALEESLFHRGFEYRTWSYGVGEFGFCETIKQASRLSGVMYGSSKVAGMEYSL
jgi:hypothetical protein